MVAAFVLVMCAWPGLDLGASAAGAVRALQARGNRLVELGCSRSGTFAQLVDKVTQSDVLVYLDLDPWDSRKLDGSLQFLGAAAGTRFVKIWLRPTRADDELIATLGHELRHAIEVASAPQVVSQASLALFYATTGRSNNPGRFDTDEARNVGERVRIELRSDVNCKIKCLGR